MSTIHYIYSTPVYTPGAIFNGHNHYFPAVKINGRWRVNRGVALCRREMAEEYAKDDIKHNFDYITARYR